MEVFVTLLPLEKLQLSTETETFKQNIFFMDIIYDNNLVGLLIGIVTFLIIGLFHPLVIKAEY